MRCVFAVLVFAVVGAEPPAVAPAPRPVSPEVQKARAAVAAAGQELARQQRLRAGGAGADDRVDVAELRLHFAATELAQLTANLRAEYASRKAEVAVLQRRYERAAGPKATEFGEGVDARLRELAEGRARLATFDGDRTALLKAHTTLVEIAERRLDRAAVLLQRKIGRAEDVKLCELALAAERDRLDAAKSARLFPRLAD